MLTPDKHYVGVGLVPAQDQHPPPTGQGQHIVLFSGNECILNRGYFIDGVEIGKQFSLSTPHEYDS